MQPRPFLEPDRVAEHRRRNLLHSVALVAGIGLLMLLSAWLIWSWTGVAFGLGLIVVLAAFGPRVGPEAVMRLYSAIPVDERRSRQLLRLVEVLADRAELPAHPRLYVVPSLTLNAFAAGTRDNAAIAITEGLLRKLTLREVAGVLAHEMSHIRNNDLRVMGLADAMSRFTQSLAWIAFCMAVINLPAALLGLTVFSWAAILLLYLAPTVSSLLQLALSRTREYDADLEAAGLTGDPVGLASALRALERYEGRFWEDLLFPFPARRIPSPSVLRTHPDTEERVRRLLQLGERAVARPISIQEEPVFSLVGVGPASLAPRYRWPGLWY